jgi:xylulokinase
MMGVNLSSTDSFNWFIQTCCRADVQAARDQGTSPFEALTDEAACSPPGAQSLYFLPYLSGERTPHADPLARGCFVGLSTSHQRGHLLRAVMEGVTYALRESLSIIRQFDVPIDEIRLTGGGAKSAFWRQMQADMFGQTVYQTNASEGAAYGVALLAAVGAGAYGSIAEACEATIRANPAAQPQDATRQFYDRAFPVYQRLYQSLRENFSEIAAVRFDAGASCPS